MKNADVYATYSNPSVYSVWYVPHGESTEGIDTSGGNKLELIASNVPQSVCRHLMGSNCSLAELKRRYESAQRVKYNT